MNNKVHNIQITNYKRKEKILHQIVLLKGLITNKKCLNNEDKIQINDNKFNVSTKNTFKVLVQLQEGLNVITLSYCCEKQTFELHYEVPTNKRRCVTPLYVIFDGHEGSFQAPSKTLNNPTVALKKLNVNIQLIQTILSEKLYETYQKHLTFHLTESKVFYSKITLKQSHELEPCDLFHKLALEIETSNFGCCDIKHIAFLSGTLYKGELYTDNMVYKDVVKITKQYIALGRGGLAVFHTACLYTWPDKLEDIMDAFGDETLINRKELLDDSNYRGTMGACYSTTLGSVLHELCHTFNLGHADFGIMSRGFDDVRDIFLVDSANAVEADRKRGGHGITDSTALHKSGAQILRYNKWFLNDDRDLPYSITFDASQNIIKSSWGIRVIELRSGETELMTKNWIYPIAKMNIQLNLTDLDDNSKLFIQDSKGNWVIHDLN